VFFFNSPYILVFFFFFFWGGGGGEGDYNCRRILKDYTAEVNKLLLS
jgi:hypothetical protein